MSETIQVVLIVLAGGGFAMGLAACVILCNYLGGEKE